MSSPIYTNRDDLAVLAWTIAVRGASETLTQLTIPHVRAMVDTAVRELSLEVWKSGMDSQRLFKDFSVGLGVDGSGNLDPTVIIESLNPDMGGAVYSATLAGLGISGWLDWLPDLGDASLAHGYEGIGSYVVKGSTGATGKIYCFDHTGAAGIFASASVTVKGAAHYSFADVPEYYKHRLVAILVQMAREKMAGISRVSQNITDAAPPPEG